MNIPPVRITTLDDEAERMACPQSAFSLPTGVRFSDDQKAVEYRMLLASYGERLTDAVKSHEPLHIIRGVVARINEITTEAIAREIRKAMVVKHGREN